jgi:Ran GTPase-activating protein (RanGAP) involved in mRNA processing and transport
MGSLVKVSMTQNGINSDGVCALASAFKNNPNLEVLDV